MSLSQSTRVSSLLVNGKIVTDPKGLEKAAIDKIQSLAECEEHSRVPLNRALRVLDKLTGLVEKVSARLQSRHLSDTQRSEIIRSNTTLNELKTWIKDNHSIETPNTFEEWSRWLLEEKETIREHLTRELGRADEQAEPESDDRDPRITKALGDEILMRDPTNAEIKEAVTAINGQSQAGSLPPAILKAVTLHTWNEPGIKDQEAEVDKKSAIKKPKAALALLKRIVRMAIRGKNLPRGEKITVTTNIPKKEGQVNNLDETRPISVSPIIGRIINKIMAKRLATALDGEDCIDQAQHAFLPGKNIHEPIQTAIH
jgi:hypothetical protein